MSEKDSQLKQATEDETVPNSLELPSYTGATASANEPGLLQVVEWPVPQFMVYCKKTKFAVGRKGLSDIGYMGFKQTVYTFTIWDRPGIFSQSEIDRAFEKSAFAGRSLFYGIFHSIHGKSDVGPVLLGSVGWADMVQNLVSIHVSYEDPKASSSI
ncbi:hypothetical protein DICSQDRAFT_152743 [Dichomitus squalens LYAD-421 SS1]|uniref:uncharacterized protein n=1 Tax=Dichomitus squalens (strain LYAD-421) TaxID=732165 RepID=UPI0004412528|nr:uncharacterized protein DICSQDRAFT_152743 [Dichomitus squalens LYAD-421 SS1]EJF65598.1 hypothetical protein DICSQDRAFT_152743 [Dichomitus squalens LYAD-421 SS1]